MKKLIIDTQPKVLKSKDINTLEFRLIFPIKYHPDNHFYIDLLKLFLTSSSYQYNDYGLFRKESARKTILNMSLGTRTLVDNTYLVFAFSTPKEGLIKDFDLDSAFAFAIDALYHPFCENGEFDLAKFQYEKDYLIENNKRHLDGIYNSNSCTFYEAIDPERHLGNTYEQDTELLDKITPKGLYEFYTKSIKENTFISLVYGDISESRVKKLFKNYANQEQEKVTISTNYFKVLPEKKCKLKKEIATSFSQSELFLLYQVPDMKESERKYLAIIINILHASENNLIFESLRVKHNLVYDVRMNPASNRAMFVITAFISPENKNATKKAINQVFKDLHDKDYLQYCLDKLLKGLEVDMLKEEDSPSSPLNKALDKLFNIPGTEEVLKEFRSVKINDLIKFIDRIKLTNEVLFKGESNDKK